MMVLIVICVLLTVAYVALMAAYILGWQRQEPLLLPAGFQPTTPISIIVPARNEQEHIGACLRAILAQQYPPHLWEVIVVDDHSTDDTGLIVDSIQDARVQCLRLSDVLPEGQKINAYKKAALAAGIGRASGTLIVTTDADCKAGPQWLRYMAAIFERDAPAMIVAPVVFEPVTGLCGIFQMIDFMGMQGVTAATHKMKLGNMSNGANLAFSKAIFEQVQGYQGLDHLASGDDYLLMMKIAKLQNASIAYIKAAEAIVATTPQPDWGSFLQQRIRWASKSGKYDDRRLTAVLLLVYFINCAIFTMALLGFFNPAYWQVAAPMLVSKIVAEWLFMLPVSAFFNKKWARVWFPFLQPLHIVYIVVAGFLGFVGTYRWKGRRVR